MNSPTAAQDVIAVLTTTGFNQVFANARALKLSIAEDSKVMEHPLEDGTTVTDHRIINPVSAELSAICASVDYPSVYQQIKDLFRRGELLTVQTRVDSYSPMIIEKIPHEETSDVFDGIAISITLKQAKFVTPQYSALPPRKVAAKKDSDTAKRGQQQPTEPKASILSGWFK